MRTKKNQSNGSAGKTVKAIRRATQCPRTGTYCEPRDSTPLPECRPNRPYSQRTLTDPLPCHIRHTKVNSGEHPRTHDCTSISPALPLNDALNGAANDHKSNRATRPGQLMTAPEARRAAPRIRISPSATTTTPPANASQPPAAVSVPDADDPSVSTLVYTTIR